MPRIPDYYLDCVIYLYPSKKAAQEGASVGGSGFLVYFPSTEHEHNGFVYAVTNSHVVHDASASVIRFNTLKDEIKVIEKTSQQWFAHPDGDDLAVVLLEGMSREHYNIRTINTAEHFISDEGIKFHDIGIGTDIFTVGRFVSHDGRERNLPSARFGSISMMPHEPVEFRNHKQECFMVEMRSLRGSSGSPVFIYHTPTRLRREDEMVISSGIDPILLGVVFAEFPYDEEVKKIKKMKGGKRTEKSTDYIAESNSGQIGVIPAWRLLEFLQKDKRLIMQRKKGDEEFAKDTNKVRPLSQKPQEPEELTRDGFEDALKRASRRVSSSDEEALHKKSPLHKK